ncbi:hypothetical protein ACFL2Q_05380 [Thermodesulfobacteriota bacterium]
MAVENNCDSCSGCTGRHDALQKNEEIAAAPYLLFAGLMIVLMSVFLRWVF